MEFGLALSGGGVRGASHIGVLLALEHEGLFPSYISGTSAGAIVASLYSCGYTPTEIKEIFLSDSYNIIDYNFKGLLKLLVSPVTRKPAKLDGIIRGDKLSKKLAKLFEEKNIYNINQVKLPLAIPSVDVNYGKQTIFVSSLPNTLYPSQIDYLEDISLSKAVRASVSLPMIFCPEMINGKRMIDGGILNNVPAKILRQMGANKVIAVNLGYTGQNEKDVDNLFEIAFQSFDIMAYRISKDLVIFADYVINPKIYDVTLLETHRLREVIDRGYLACKLQMNEIKAALYQ